MKKIAILLVLLFTVCRPQLTDALKFNEIKSFIAVDFFDVTTGLVLASNGEIYRSADGGLTLTRVAIQGNRGITNLHISRTGVAYICGHGGMLMTSSDRGQTWSDISLSGYPGLKLNFVSTLSASTLIVAGENGFYAKSEDNGANWSVATIGTGDISKVVFTDQNRGYILYQHGGVYSTSNGGVSWNGHFLPYSGSPIVAVFSYGSNRLFLARDYRLIFSIDGGLTYSLSATSATTKILAAVEVEPGRAFGLTSTFNTFKIDYTGSGAAIDFYTLPTNRIYTGFWIKGSKLFLTAEGPDLLYKDPANNPTFSTVVSFADRPLHTINVTGENDWTISGSVYSTWKGRIARTTNGGTSWSYLYDDKWTGNCTFLTSDQGVRVRDKSIDYTLNGGATWQTALTFSSGVIISERSFTYDTGFYIVTDSLEKPVSTARSTIYRRSGTSSTQQLNLAGARLTHLNFTSPQNGWVLRDSTRFYTTENSGSVWNLKPVVTPLISDYERIGDTAGILVTRKGLIMKTNNKAVNWTTIFSDSTVAFNTMDIKDSTVIAAGDSGALYISLDMGNTWNRRETNRSLNFTAVKFATADQFLLATRTGGLYKGGVAGTQSHVLTNETTTPDTWLIGNYPNPFNPETVIRFVLPVAGYAKGVVYDFLGREVATLVDGETSAGTHEIKFDANGLPSGVYIFRLETGKTSEAIKMLLMK